MLPLDRIVEEFSLDAVSKSAPIFNRKKLEWLNSFYIRNKKDETLSGLLLPYFEKSGLSPGEIGRDRLIEIAGVVKDNLVVLSQIEDYLGIFFDERFSFEEKAKAVLKEPANRETIRSVLQVLEETPEMATDGPSPLLPLLEEKTGRKGKDLYAPLRAGITGKTRGPELAKLFPLLGRERMIHRLKMALEVT